MNILKKTYRAIFNASVNSVYLCKLTLYMHNKGYRFVAILLKNRLISKYGIHLGLGSEIGKNLKLPHPHGIIIGDGVSVGSDCTIYHNVTLGRKHSISENKIQYPYIGNNVIIYTGTVILGGIKIGDNSIIGANSFVVQDLDSNSLYAGNPIKKIRDLSD